MPIIENAATYDLSLRAADFKIENKLAHEGRKKTCNTRSADVKFQIRQTAYCKKLKQNLKNENYDAKLNSKHIKCTVLKVIGNSMY